MADVLNLRRFRKARQRVDREAAADRNRIAFGRGKQARIAETALAERESRRLDGHLRETDRPDIPDANGPDE